MVKFNWDFRVEVVTKYLGGIGSHSLAQKYHIGSSATILIWVNQFHKYGIDGLKPRNKDIDYSSQFKIEVLNWRKQHQASLPVTALHFNLTSPSTIWQWEKRFKKLGIVGLKRKRGNPKIMSKHKQIKSSKTSDKPNIATELKQLKQENLMLKIENEYLKKLDALARENSVNKQSPK